MSETIGPYEVCNLMVRQSPRIDESGNAVVATIVSFTVGTRGPFTVTYATLTPTTDQIMGDVTAQVNQLRDLDGRVLTVNAQG